MQDLTLPIEAQDIGRTLKGGEHHRQPPVGAQMGRRLVAAAGQIDPTDGVIAQHAKIARAAR